MSGGKTMSVCIKSGFLVQILVFLSSCSLIGGLGFGSKDVCADGACETSRILNNPQSQKKWYCYGVAADRSWDCVSQPQPEKIATVIPTPAKSQTRSPALMENITRPSPLTTPADPDEGANATRSAQQAHSH